MNDTVKKATTYSPEDVKTLTALYNAGEGNVDEIAKEMNRTKRSIIGKLVSLGLYVKAAAPVKVYKDEGPTKKEILSRLKAVGLSEETLKGLGSATKGALEVIADRLEASSPVTVDEPAVEAA